MGKRKLSSIILLDVEATCWMPRDAQPEDQRSEIIELGLCKLNPFTGEISDKKSYMVKPVCSTITEFCTKLTSITPEQIKAEGIPFEHAVNKMKKEFGTKNKVWASWGDYDRKHVKRDCAWHNIPYPFSSTHINVKTLYSLCFGFSKEFGLTTALEQLNLKFEGVHHRGCDDAFNTARILYECIKQT